MKKILMTALISVFSVSSFGATLNCGGTEPFWGLKITDKSMTFSSPESLKPVVLSVVSRQEAHGFSAGFAFVVKSKFSRATVIGGTCSDGMSDRTYSHSIVFENGNGVLAGCCDVAN
jgi:uncharacterized membrane protein